MKITMKITIDSELLFSDSFKIKAKRHKQSFTHPDKRNTVLIYKTAQGGAKNSGINIDMRIPELRNYANANLFLIGDNLFIVPLRKFEEEAFRVSLNRDNSELATIKIGSFSEVQKLQKFAGEYPVSRFENEKNIFYLVHLDVV